MELNRLHLETRLNPAGMGQKKLVASKEQIIESLHPNGLPADFVDPPVPQDLAERLNPTHLQPQNKGETAAPEQTNLAQALQTQGTPQSSPPAVLTNLADQLNPPELQPGPTSTVPKAPINIRQLLDGGPQGKIAENTTGSLTYFS